MKRNIAILMAFLAVMFNCKAQEEKSMEKENVNKGVVVDINTTMGDIKVLLYDDTPLHRDNFVKNVKDGVYDGVLFHRVIDNFMVQAGDPTSKNAESGARLGEGDLNYTVPAEIVYPKYYHKYGALAAARQGDQVNPARRSSASQFYIVTGHKLSENEMKRLAYRYEDVEIQKAWEIYINQHRDEINSVGASGNKADMDELGQRLLAEFKASYTPTPIPENIVKDYMTIGGAPHLDGEYTVFGEVLEGMDVVEKIQKAETDRNDRPLEDIRIISMKVE